MAVGTDLALDPPTPLPGVRGKRLESGALGGLEHGAAGGAARHGRVVEPVELAADGGVHRVEREERLVAQHEQDAGLDRADRRLHEPLVNYLQMQAVPLDGMTFGALASRTRSIRYGAARCASTIA